ncbi:PREDICTED: uncharacterized protein LOC105456446 [Wasmannia auropunctata]|uniref:uncharacterized protein LOC105456446 n=1 Tax=Wasmannia auropunctata TaxID=64793 RepID=UPI0005EFC9B9|nr:PREDICTED: uncharacterized protein LOC105456446 [Wasmannia auropunctata]
MDAIKKQRKILRTAFTRALNAFSTTMDSDCSRDDKMVAFQFLETKMTELDTVHATYSNALFQSNLDEEAIAKELEVDDVYKTQYLTAKMRVTALLSATPDGGSRTTIANTTKTSKFPKLELPKFSGNIKEWLPFWSQFKKINDDPSISNEDKFQYLLQATIPDSRASELVKSFPPTGENYGKAIASLKNRFGRDDIVVEFYVRELLGLVLQNAVKGNKKTSLSSIFDKIECYIRALETLGVTTDKCAAMLYPLVESTLPEEVLRAWQRSGQRGTTEVNGQRETMDRLAKLLKFLQVEVDNEERIDMALTGFGLSADAEKARKQKNKSETLKETASASVFLVSKEQKKPVCIFCKANHESSNCEEARKLTLNERKEIVKRENGCFNCLIRGHAALRCRSRLKCDWCSKRHVLLMCPTITRDESAPANKVEDNKKTVEESNLVTFCERHEVYLQTLRVKLYSASREKIVRAVIDTASQRSYIRTEVAKELGYASRGELEVTHSLFGGAKSEVEKHNMFLIRMRSLDGSYACNFSAMNQDIICGTISGIKIDTWVNELRDKNINLTDIGGGINPIDVLIGADIAGKLMTGRKYNLKNGLTAFETLVGWTVMGKLPVVSQRDDTATMIATLFVQEADPSDLWRLDVIGITDPIGKADKVVRDEQVRESLRETIKLNDYGRYEVKLPWVNDHVPVSSNYDIARNRLQRCVQKLKAQDLFDAYNNVFQEWLLEGVVERVPDSELNNLGHYLPHRPVVKTHGTTKIRPVFDASACRKGYPSLNQCLETGPNLIELVPSSLNKFREREIGIVSDIKKAFLQISVHENDRDYLRFLWMRDNEIVIFRHCRVVFGLACSPFLLAAILEFHLSTYTENAEQTRNTVQRLKGAFYVDNCVTSVDSKKEAESFVREATSILAAGGFELRGWESSGDSKENETSLVLGLLWNKMEDTISINPSIKHK